MKKVILLLYISLLALTSNAQYVFKVLAAEGGTQIYSNNTWENAVAGTEINTNEKIKITNNGYLGLIHQDGEILELKTIGVYSLVDLETKVSAKNSTLGTTYGALVSQGMFAANTNATSNYTTAETIYKGNTTSIIIYAPQKIKALKKDPLTLHWNNCGEGYRYTITLTDFFGQVINTIESTTNSATLDFSTMNLKVEDEMDERLKQSYLLTIQSKTNPECTSSNDPKNTSKGHNYQIEVVETLREKEISSAINQVKATIDATSALDQMVLAAAYEKQGLMTYAVSSYHKAQELAPNVSDFKLQYEEYIKTKLVIDTIKGKFDK